MNKIFKVVWNRTIGSFVVTSELAKGRVKSSSEGAEGDVRTSEEGRLKTLFRLTALSAALLGFSEGAWAVIPEKTPTGGAVFAIGTGTTSAHGTGALSLGHNAQAKNNGALAIGPNSGTSPTIANSNNSIAIGVNLRADGSKAIGIGADTTVNGSGAIAIGNNDSGRMANQGVNGNGAIGVGSNLTANGNNAIAVGTEAQAKAISAVAVGADTQATGVEAVAIGKGAASTASKALAFGQGAQAKADDTVAVGTGAQATLANSIAIGKNSFARGLYSGVKGDGRAIAIGFNTQALGEDSVAIGSGVDGNAAALAQNRQSVALGWQARATGTTQAVAIGPQAYASGAQSTSIGNNTRATGDSSIAIGGDDWDDAKKSVNTQYKALTGSDMSGGYQGTTSATAAVAVGVKAQATGALSTAFGPGTIASGLGTSAFGVGASATQDKSVAIGAGSHTNTDATAVTTATVNGITYGGFAGTTHITSGSQVSFGSEGYERQLKHVAPGEITATSTDAINGSQLYALHAGSGNIAKAVANALGGGAAVGIDPTNNQGTVTLPSYDVFKGNATPNATGSSTTKFNTAAATSVGGALTNLNTYVNQGFAVKDNAGAAKGIVTPGESVQFADGNATTVTVETEANGNTKIKYDVQVDGETVKIENGKLTAASQTHFYSVNSTDKTKANYNNDGATGENAIAAGPEAKAAANNAVVMGNKATVEAAAGSDPDVNGETTGESSVAVGSESTASGKNAVAIGQQANAYGENTFAGGQGAKALGKSSVAVGEGAKANERNTIAIGSGNNAWKIDSIALGRAANADGAASLALGLSSHTREANAIALGNNANADDTNSIAIGTNSKAAQAAAVAIGNNATALKYSSIVIGEEAKSNNSRSVVIGYNASATNPAMSASNQDTNQTVAIGAYANAWGDQSTAIGNNVDAKGNSSIAIGADDWDTVAVKTVDGAGGKTVKEVYQDYTGDVMVTGSYTHTTSSEAAVAIGTKSQAIGELSTAFGTGTIAEGVASAAFGMGAKATKGNSVAIGAGSTTTTNAISVNEATVNNLKYSGFAGGNNVTSGDQVSFGSKNYERQLKNVAPGEISSTSTDAINGSQLYAVQNVLGNTAKTVKNVLGGNAAVGEDGGFTMSNIGGTGQNTIDAAIRELNTNAYKPFKLTTAQTGGTNGVAENHTLQDVTSGSTITLEAGKNISLRQNGATVSINTVDNPEFTGKVTAKGGLDMSGNKITNVLSGTDTKDAVNLGQLQDAMANLSVSTLTTVNNDAPFSYVGTDGRILRREVTVAPGTGVKTVSFKHIDDNTEYSGGVTIAALNPTDPQTTTPTTVGNVKNGAKDNDAVNVSQLNKIAEAIGTQVNPDGTITAPTYNVISGDPSKTSVANYNTVGGALTALSSAVRTPLYFEGDSGEKIDRLLGSTVAVKGGQNNADKLSENNIGVVADKNSGTLNVKLAKELTGLTSAAFSGDVTAAGTTVNGSGVTIGSGSNPVSLTAGGLSNGGNKVTNIADGVADTDAASFKQVKAAKTEVQGGTNVASVTKTDNPTDGHTVYTVNAKGAAVALDSSVDGLKLTSSEDTTTNVTTYKLDLSDKTKASLTKADSALQNIGVQVNGTDAKTLTKDDSTLNFVNGTGTTAENKNGTVAFNVNKSTLTASTGGLVSADKAGDAFATAADVAQAINEAVANSEKTSVVEKGDNTHVTAVEAGNKTTYTVHADNTTVSVKDGGKLKLESSEKANANQTKTTNYELDLTDAAKAEIQKGVDAKTAVDTKGITFNGDSGSPVTKKLDETLAIKGDDKNVVTEAGTDGIKVKLKDDITLTSVTADTLKAGNSELTSAGLTTPKVTAGDSVLTTDGLKIGADGSSNQVSLTNAGLNNGGNKITKVAEGTLAADSTDAVNGAQLYKVDQKANTNAENIAKGINVGGTTGSKKYALGDTVNIKGDNNIVSDTVEGGVQLKLADTVKIGQDSGKPVSIDGTTGTVSGLTNTTLGTTPLAGSNKAATEAQLDATQVNLATILGGNAANNNGNVTTSNIGGTGKDNVHEAIAAVKETADKGWNLKANDETDSEKIAAGDTVTVKQGKNIRVKRSGKDLTVETEDDVAFNKVTVGASELTTTGLTTPKVTAGDSVLTTDGLKIGADGSSNQVSLTNSGLNNGGNKIANVAKGTAATDAVNVAQLNEQLAATEKTTTVVAGKNVTVSEKVDGNNTEYTVNADKTTLSQAANGAVKVSEGAKDADGVTDYALDLTDEAKADIAKGVAAKDAVDNKGLTFAADNGTTGAKKLGDSLSVKGDGNILTRADENGIGFSLADKITVGKAGKGNKPLVIDGTAGLISGLSNTTLGGADFATKGQAASEEQLNAAQANLVNLLGGNAANNNGNVTTTDIGGTGKDNVHDAIAAVKETADKGWNLNANDETSSEKIGAGDTVTFKEGKNVKVSRNGKHITVATSDDVSFDKVTVGGSVLTDNGLTVGNGKAGKPVSLTKDGLNNGGNKIANVAKGTDDTDAVNVAQLKAAAAKATSKVDSGNDNIVVTPEQNADGSTTYKVATAPDLKADSFTAGDTVVNNDGVKVGDKVTLGKDGLKAGDVNITADGINAGNKAISNVAAGVKDTDAANVGQLNRLTAAAKTEVEAGTNIASVTSKQGANGQTVYTVNADGASVSAGSDNIVVTKGNKDADNVTDYAVDLSKAVKADIAKGVAAKDAVDNKGISFAGDSGTTVANKLGDTVAVKGDANITTTAGANGIQVGLNKDLKVDSVKAGDTVVNNNGVNVGDKVALGKDGLKAGDVNITADGINAGGKKVTGVAAGTVAAGSTDAVNGGQLHQVYELIGSNGGNVNTAPPSVEADGKAGLGNIKNITLVDNSNNPNVTNVTNETKIAQSNGYSLVTYNVEDQGMYVTNNVIEAVGRMNEQGIKFFHTNDGEVNPDVQARNGEDSSASGAYATAVGYQAASKGTNAIAIGKGAKANAENTIAIGTGNIVSGKNSGAIGDPTVVSGNSSYSIGNNNNVSADNAYALGSNIKATVNDSVYLGDRAQTQGIHTADAAKGEAYTYGGLNDKAVAGKAGSTAAANKVAGVVTVGNGTDETRQVQGVAAGVVSADSTDAINGSQLYYTNQAIANVATQATAAKTEVTAGKNVVVNQTTGNSGQTVYNVATADKLDVASVTAGGVTVNAQGVSIAAPTANNPSNTVSLSPIGLNNGGQRITNVAPAKEGTDAVNLNQLAGMGNALQNNIERVGKKAYAGVAGAIAQGSIPQVTRPGATGIGVGSGYYGGQSAMAIGVSAMSDGGNWVVKGNFSANTDGHVGVGAGALYQW